MFSRRLLLTTLAIIFLLATTAHPVQAQVFEDFRLFTMDVYPSGEFGYSVDLDHDLAIMGAHHHSPVALYSGAAYIFDIADGTQLFELLPADAAEGDMYGSRVAIDGAHALVAASRHDNQRGTVYVHSTTTGSQLRQLFASDGSQGDWFGIDVALEGNIALVGAHLNGVGGAVYVFDVNTGQELGKIVPADIGTHDRFGWSVDLQGGVAAIGSFADDDMGADSGAVYLFDVNTGAQLHKLTAADGGTIDLLGYSVAISESYVVAAAYGDEINYIDCGSAYVFDRATGAQLWKLVAADPDDLDDFGNWVAIQGNYALVGAPSETPTEDYTGAVYCYDLRTGEEVVKLKASDGEYGDLLGYSVAASEDWIMAGAPGDSRGSAYFFEMPRDPQLFEPVATGIPGTFGAALAWGDFDTDGDLDLLISGYPNDPRSAESGSAARDWIDPQTWIYANDGGTFTDIQAGLPPIDSGDVDWVDFDGDGDLDVFLSGSNISKLFRNDDGSFADTGVAFPGVRFASSDWGDFDNDGDLDLALGGQTYEIFADVFRNDGDGNFLALEADLVSSLAGRVNTLSWVDYDSDGDLDLLLGGTSPQLGGVGVRIFRNEGNTFIDAQFDFPLDRGFYASWADYDNDGDPDLLIGGLQDSQFPKVYLYRNDQGAFIDSGLDLGYQFYYAIWGDYDNDGLQDLLLPINVISPVILRNVGDGFEELDISLEGLQEGDAAWGDFDGDNDLDFVLCGVGPAGYADMRTTIFRNDVQTPNTAPSAPTNLGHSENRSAVTLSWGPAEDLQTPAAALTYNLRVGTAPGLDDVIPSQSDPNSGARLVVASGNVGSSLSWALDGLQEGTFYWSVQAVDSGFLGGPFAAEESFTIGAVNAVPEVPGAGNRPRLLAAAPNPFNPRTVIAFELPATTRVDLEIFDMAGRLVRQLVANEDRKAGHHEVIWQGRDETGRSLPSGSYCYRLTAGGFSQTRRLTLLK